MTRQKKTSSTFRWYRGGSLMISFPAAYSTFLCITDLVPEGKLFSIVKSKIGEWEYNWCYNLQKNRFRSPNNHLNSLLETIKRLIVKEGKVANSRMIKSELKSFFNLLLFGQRLIKRFPLFATQDQCDLIIVINYSRWLNMNLITINTENIENWKIAGWHTMKV